MGKAFAIFRRDLRRVLGNPVAVIVTIGVCIIPSLYAWFNILANWDPYKNTGTLAVAVVVRDRGADIPGMGYVNAGDMVKAELEENTQLGWEFMDEDEAMRDVESGACYAAIVVPEDFTSSLAGVLDGKTEKVRVGYFVNEKLNAVAPKVTDTGASVMEDQINNTFVSTVSKVVSEKVKGAAGEAAAAIGSASGTVVGDVRGVSESLRGAADGVDSTRGTIDSAREAISRGRATLDQASSDAKSLSAALAQDLGTLSSTRSKAQAFLSALGATVGDGGSRLAAISSRANYDIGEMAGDIGWAQGRIDAAIAQIEAANGSTRSLKAALTSERDVIAGISGPEGSLPYQAQVVRDLDAQIDRLVELDEGQKALLDRLKQASADIRAGSDSVRGLSQSVNAAIQGSSAELAAVRSRLDAQTIPQLSSALDSFADVGGGLRGSLDMLPLLLSQADSSLAQLDAVLDGCRAASGDTARLLRRAADQLDGVADDVLALQSAEHVDLFSQLIALNPESVSSFMLSPARLVDSPIFPVKNYGSGVAPFYTNLALWVGGFVLVAIFKLEVDKEGVGDYKPWQGYIGRGMLLILFGQVQALICCVGDLVLGVQSVSPAAFVIAGLVESFCYVNFIYALSIAFKHIGKALAVLLVVLQIPGSSGMYPIQMMPDFFQALYPWLPFTYGINAMREAVAGFYGNYYAWNLFVLSLLFPISLLIGITARRWLLNINALFDRRLGETEMMVTERYNLDEAHFRLSTIIKALMSSGKYKEVFLERAANFELRYPLMVRRSILALFVVPPVLLVLMLVLPFKMVLLTLWIVSLLVICILLIVIEYLHNRVGEKTALADKSPEELYDMMGDQLKSELLAFAPIEKMRLDNVTAQDVIRDIIDRRRGSGRPEDGGSDGGADKPEGGDEQ